MATSKTTNSNNGNINKPADLITTRAQTRTGFIKFALEKNYRSTPIIDSAKSLKHLASKATTPQALLKIKDIQPALLTAAVLSDKAIAYFTDKDKVAAIKELIKNFLVPAGKDFIDELVYRYLLIKGDSLGGSMRNLVGAMAQQKLIRTILSNMDVMGVDYKWFDNDAKKWCTAPKNIIQIESRLKAVCWEYKKKERVLAFNLNIPIVKNNVDICLFNANITTYDKGNIVNQAKDILMLGELKGGIDPAGADEHWKTGNSALNRIRTAFNNSNIPIATSFVAAAIEKKMASEIYNQLQKSTLSFAANLTIDKQLVNYCNWIITF